MTVEEKKIYNNGFILGMASKGVIRVVEKISDDSGITATEMWYLLDQDFVEVGI